MAQARPSAAGERCLRSRMARLERDAGVRWTMFSPISARVYHNLPFECKTFRAQGTPGFESGTC